MSTTSHDNLEKTVGSEASLSPEARRSRITVHPDNAQLIGVIMGYMGLETRDYGLVQIGGSEADTTQEAALLGWTPLAHRSVEEVGAGVVRAVTALQELFSGKPDPNRDLYERTNDFNWLLFEERMANTDPLRRGAEEINFSAELSPYPGFHITEQHYQDDTTRLNLHPVPDLRNVNRSPTN